MTDTSGGAPVERGQWGSRWGFILAAAGSAVGLGNIWKFPYIAGENGGGLFVLIYLVCIALVGLPIMVAEIMIGRAAQKQPVAAFHTLQGGRTGWAAVGWMGVVAGFVILSFYIVVAGWAMDYTLKSVANFTQPIAHEAEQSAKNYRVETPLAEMRGMLVEKRAVKEAKKPQAAIARTAPPSVWREFDVFTTAMGKVSSAADKDRARQVLFEDEELRAAVETAEPLLVEMEGVLAAELEKAESHYSQLSDRDIRDEAETEIRRAGIAERVKDAFMGQPAADGSGQLGILFDGWTSTFWSLLFILITILIVSGGISAGIERACTILMPTLMGLIAVMVIYGFFQPGFSEAVHFIFWPDPSNLRPRGVLEALGHAFFTLSLGMGAMITYGSYQKSKHGLVSESIAIAIFDTVIALAACMMIFPIIFSYGQEPSAGPGLVFVSMPLAFAEIGQGGMLLAILFFGLLVFAALTSAISLLEVVCSYFIDERGWKRHRAAWVIGGVTFLFGIPSAFANSDGFLMGSWSEGFGMNFFDTMDYLASNWMLPMGGLFISIYAGWVMPARLRAAEVAEVSPILFSCWLFLVRVVAPALVILVLLQRVGIIHPNEWFT